MTTPSYIAQDIIDELEPVLAQHPDSMRFARLADAYLAVGRPDKAVALCEQGLQYHPRYAAGRLVLAKALLAQGEQTKALHTLKSLLDQDPRHPMAWKYYGDLQHSLGKEGPAELSYAELLNLDPLNDDVRAILTAMRQHRVSPSVEEPGAPTTSTLPSEAPTLSPEIETVEDRFSYILDDIFREEESAPPTLEDEETSTPQGADFQEFFWPEPEAAEPVPETGAKLQEPPAEPPPAEPVVEQLFETEEEPLSAPEAQAEEPPSPAAQPQDSAAHEERIVTPTLGEIYAAQGQYAKAISVFTILARKYPDNPRFRERIEQLQRKLDESTGEI